MAGAPWGPQVSEDPKGIRKYVFRVYFLPVPSAPSLLKPTYWTEELLQYITNNANDATIDPNSACWRIFHVVTNIEYNDGSSWLYNGSLDKPSVYGTVNNVKGK